MTPCIQIDTLIKMYIFLRTQEFDNWLKRLRDPLGKARIIARIRSAEAGNFGDCESVGKRVSEVRISYGPGVTIQGGPRWWQVAGNCPLNGYVRAIGFISQEKGGLCIFCCAVAIIRAKKKTSRKPVSWL